MKWYTCIHQRENGLTYFDVPAVDKSLIDLISKNVGYGSTVFTDEYSAYNQLQKHGHTRKCNIHRRNMQMMKYM
jgi:transposase-like protein